MRCLILRLEAPLVAFGDVAVDEIRPTRRLPTQSMMTGLLGNALGFDHRDVEVLQRLQDRLRFAARLDREGQRLVDYQTARLNKRDPLWTTRGVPAERAGGGSTWDSKGFGTVERLRHYRAGTCVTVALTVDPAGEPPTLDDLASALRRPERPLFLGRKSCVPARPLLERVLEDAPSLAAALATAPLERAAADSGPALVETPDLPDEPAGGRVRDVPDRRDWRLGLHAGTRRLREQWLKPGDVT